MVHGRRLIRDLLVGIAAVVALAAIAVIAVVLLVDFDVLISKYQDRAVEAASTAIGRTIEVGEVRPSWWPVGIEAKDVTIEGIAHADALEFEVSLFELMRSFGKEIEVDSIVLR